MSGLRLPGFKELSKKVKLNTFLDPKKIYIPLISSHDTDLDILVSEGDKVYKGQIVARRKSNFKTPLFSSVSGTVVGFKEVIHQTGEKVNSIVIENDFKEKIDKDQAIRKNIRKMSKQEFLDTLMSCGVVGMGGAGFPTYVKYDTEEKISTLIVNAVECEPYITADYRMIMEKSEEILETIDAILGINNISEAIIGVKETNSELIKELNKYIGSYLKIKIYEVPNKYPMGWERTLIKEIKKVEYDKLTLEKGIIVNNISTIYSIGEAIRYNKPLIERIVTFTGEGLKKPQNVLVKVGTSIKDILEFIGGVKKDTVLIAGGPMMGSETSEDLIITPDLNCVLVLNKRPMQPLKRCLRCGKCADVCPANLCPVLIKDSINNIGKLKELHAEKCVECALCSYVCPSKIEVREYVGKAKKLLKERG